MIIFDNVFCRKSDAHTENNFDSLINRIKANDPAISSLDIRGNLNPEQFGSLFKALKKNNIVENLILRGEGFKCDLSNEYIHFGLSNLLHINKNLKALTLYNTNVNDTGIEAISSALESNNTLNNLKISGHNIGTSGQLSLVKLLQQNNDLEDFTLSNPAMDEFARVALLAQEKYMAPKKLDIGSGNYKTFCAPTSFYENVPYEYHFLTHKDEYQVRENPIEFSLKQKENNIHKLVTLLEGKEFPQVFIKTTKDFCNDNLIKAEKQLAKQYGLLQDEYDTRIKIYNNKPAKLDGLNTQERMKMIEASRDKKAKMDELKNQYNNAKSELIKKYNDTQKQKWRFLNEIEMNFSAQDKNIEKKTAEIQSIKEQNIPQALTSLTVDNDKLVELPVAKQLAIEGKLKAGENLSEWTKKVSEADYDTAILSIGGRNKISQQIPAFSDGLGQTAILNIDQIFSDDEIRNVSKSNDVSVNYVAGKIQVADRFSLNPNQKKQHTEDNVIKQEELSKDICRLISSGKKVILLSHISPLAPRICFDKILKDQDIMKHYGEDFLFIHSYTENHPTILCSKDFVDEMMEPNMKAPEVLSKYVNNPNVESKGQELEDLVIQDKITGLYDRCERNIQHKISENPLRTPEGTVYPTLSMVKAKDVRVLLGLNDKFESKDKHSSKFITSDLRKAPQKSDRFQDKIEKKFVLDKVKPEKPKKTASFVEKIGKGKAGKTQSYSEEISKNKESNKRNSKSL
ncbi:MAG: hypothetical protein K0Q51_1246 [Rickettsiaceae bacterium]|jgi:hypothetical protein|nr:hypothetical protein [Rickettsiaceae bacterium]